MSETIWKPQPYARLSYFSKPRIRLPVLWPLDQKIQRRTLTIPFRIERLDNPFPSMARWFYLVGHSFTPSSFW
jgi:hypothetical protein